MENNRIYNENFKIMGISNSALKTMSLFSIDLVLFNKEIQLQKFNSGLLKAIMLLFSSSQFNFDSNRFINSVDVGKFINCD